jgi:hypothetical protein
MTQDNHPITTTTITCLTLLPICKVLQNPCCKPISKSSIKYIVKLLTGLLTNKVALLPSIDPLLVTDRLPKVAKDPHLKALDLVRPPTARLLTEDMRKDHLISRILSFRVALPPIHPMDRALHPKATINAHPRNSKDRAHRRDHRVPAALVPTVLDPRLARLNNKIPIDLWPCKKMCKITVFFFFLLSLL